MKQLMLAVVVAAAAFALSAKEKPFVAFVDVADAVGRPRLEAIVTNTVPEAMPCVRVKFVAVPDCKPADYLAVAAKDRRLGEGAALAVYFVRAKEMPRYITVPGKFAVVNLAAFELAAEPDKLEKRLQRLALKGLAFACGFGANHDSGRCVMGAGSFDTVKGLDGTSASFSPFVSFPLMDYLNERGLMKEE